MKVAFIYSYNPDEIWSTPLSLATEFQSRGWGVNIYSLLSSTGNYTEAGIRMMLDEIESGNYSPEIIMFMDWGRFDSSWLDKKYYPKAFWIQEAGDEPQNFDNNFPKSDRFDLVCSPDYMSTQKYLLAGRNAIWFPHWADSVIHYDSHLMTKFDAVSTRGRGSSHVLDALESILPYGRFSNKSGFEGIKHSEALQSGKMVIQHSRWGEITRRIFEAMACGRMVLTDRLSPDTHIDDIFKENIDIVYYDDVKDCINKIDYYCINAHERDVIAASGKNKVTGNHTQYQRVNTILKNFRSWKNSR